jgi:hypothetical protein
MRLKTPSLEDLVVYIRSETLYTTKSEIFSRKSSGRRAGIEVEVRPKFRFSQKEFIFRRILSIPDYPENLSKKYSG